MDAKRMVISTAVAMALFMAWILFVNYADRTWDSSKRPDAQTASSVPTSQPAAAAGQSPATRPDATAVELENAGLQVISQADSKVPLMVNLGSSARKDPQFALLVRTMASGGAGIDSVVLNDFLLSVEDPEKKPYVFQQADATVLQQYGHPLATRTITIDGAPVDVSTATWALEKKDPNAVTYAITIGRGSKPVLKVLKTYRVFERNSTEHPGLGYEIRLDYDFENHSGKPLAVSMSYNGPAMPPKELTGGIDQRVMTGYAVGLNIEVENTFVESFSGDETTRDFAVKDKVPMSWGGSSSVYFQAIVMPPLQEAGPEKKSSTSSFKAIGLNPAAADRQPVALTVDTAAMSIGANHHLNHPIQVYFGPKWRKVLSEPFYATLPRDYDHTLVVRSGPCSKCTFDWLIDVLVYMLGTFHVVTKDWGLAIICLVILVRLALHPITKRSQVSMMKLGKMGPEMKRLQEKYKDNKAELQKAMWEVQKQQGITPFLGCLPMFLQMPIWIALWSALNTTFELRHSNFLWGWTWIDDLAKPDRLIPLGSASFTVPWIGAHVDAINLLPVLLAFVFYLQQKFTPKPPTMTPEQAQQQKMVQGMMVFLFPLFLYAQPSGLNLYILTSTGIGIWESKRIRDHIKQKEEAEKAGIVIVDAEPQKGGGGGKGKKKDPLTRSGGKGGPGAKQPAPGGWLARKLAELQEKAEQARRQSERRGRDRA